ncbi:MAG: YtxH domain-containing protein [Microcoleaceae cyanobacterium]
MSKKTGIFLAGMLVGAATGAITGLLLAPRSGRKTRQMLKKSAEVLPELAEDLSTNLQYQVDKLSESTNIGALTKNIAWEGTLNRLKIAIIAGIEASQTKEYDDDNSDLSSNEQEKVEDNDFSESMQEK